MCSHAVRTRFVVYSVHFEPSGRHTRPILGHFAPFLLQTNHEPPGSWCRDPWLLASRYVGGIAAIIWMEQRTPQRGILFIYTSDALSLSSPHLFRYHCLPSSPNGVLLREDIHSCAEASKLTLVYFNPMVFLFLLLTWEIFLKIFNASDRL